jgi:hypothetical protein
VRPGLTRGKAEALGALAGALRSAVAADAADQVSVVLDAEQVEVWLTALNDLRLALGTRLGVTEDRADRDLDPDDPAAEWWSVYDYLTWFQGMLVEALIGGIDPNEDAEDDA